MNPPDVTADQLADLLAGYSEALAAGTEVAVPPAPPGLRERLGPLQRLLCRIETDRLNETPADREVREGSRSDAGAALPSANLPGRLGRFHILRELGQGGCGIVYLARDPALDRLVALKVPRPEAFFTPQLRHRFLREGQIAAELDHPNLVPVHEAGEAGAVCYIASAYCPGQNLAEWLRGRTEPVSPRLAALLTATLAEAVHHAHQRGVIHRDLKPANVLLHKAEGDSPGPGSEGVMAELGVPRICDFGLARFLDGGGIQTCTGAVVGTPAYMAPEQAAGRKQDVSVTTDVWALGVILYECLTGQRPFQAESDHDTLQRVLTEPPVAPRRLLPALPRDLETICLKCLQKEPDKRYANAADLGADLRSFLAGEPIRARRAGACERAVRWARRRPVRATLLGAGAAVVLLLLAGILVHYAQLQKHNAELEAAARRERLQADAARRQAYVSNLWLAGKLWEEGQRGLFGERLNQMRPGPGEEDLRGFEWHYLWRQGRGLRQLRGHRAGLDVVTFSPDGRLCASGGADGSVKLWDTATGQLRATLDGHTGTVVALAFSPDGRRLASGTNDRDIRGELKLWDVASGQQEMDLSSDCTSVPFVAFSPDGQSLLNWRNLRNGIADVQPWDLATGRELPTPVRRADKRSITAGGLSRDGRLLAVAYEYYEETSPERRYGVRVWNRVSGKELADLRGQVGIIGCLAFAPDGRMLATGSHDETLRLWDMTKPGHLISVGKLDAGVLSVCFSPDGRTMATGERRNPETGRGGAVLLWDIVLLWDPEHPSRWARKREELRPDCSIGALAFAPGGRTLAVGCGDRLVRLWEPAGVEPFTSLPGHTPAEAWAVTFSPDGRALATGGDDHHVRLWDLPAARQRFALEGQSLVSCVAYSPDGRFVASGSFDATVQLWDAAAGKPRATLRGHTRPVRCVAFSPDGETLASGCKGGVVKIWNVTAGTERLTLSETGNQVRCVVFSADGRLLAAGGEDSRVRVYETATGREISLLSTPSPVYSLAFVGSETLLTGHKDGVLRTWDLASGKNRATLLGHTAEVRSVAISPDGRTLASGSADRTVRLWQAATGMELLCLKGQPHEVNAVAFSADGRTLAAALHDGSVRLWEGGEE